MKRTILLITSLLIVSLGLHACARKNSSDGRMLAKVSSKIITVGDFESKIAKMPPYYREMVEKNKKKYMDELIAEMLFYEEAVRKGIDRDREINEIAQEAKRKIVITKLIKTEVDDKASVTEQEMKKFYEDHKDEFKTPELWRASHILVADEKDAKAIMDELSKGASFEELARAHSTDATATRGGDVGYFRQGQVIPDFEKTCMKLKVGETSDIIKTQFGYHIIKLTDKKEAGAQTYEEARRAIENELKRKKRANLFNKLVMDLKSKYGVEIKEDIFESLEKPGKNNIAGPKK